MVPSPPISAARMQRRAFTLLELIVVLSILTIMASVAAPKYASAVARYRLDSAATRITADIEQTRAMARASGSTQILSFVPSSSSYSIVGYRVGTSRSSDYTVKLNQPPYSVTLESASFAGSKDLQFGGFGLPADGGVIVVRSGSNTRTITIDSASGAAVIQ
ncbi:MAG: pilus assembly FimT family protein [Phycisphaerales bacterium]